METAGSSRLGSDETASSNARGRQIACGILADSCSRVEQLVAKGAKREHAFTKAVNRSAPFEAAVNLVEEVSSMQRHRTGSLTWIPSYI